MGHCVSKSGAGIQRRGFRHDVIEAGPTATDGAAPISSRARDCVIQLPQHVLDNLTVSLWADLLFNASGAHRRMYWIADFGNRLSCETIGLDVESRFDAVKSELCLLTRAQRVQRLHELPTLSWFHLLLFYDAQAAEQLEKLTDALASDRWAPNVSESLSPRVPSTLSSTDSRGKLPQQPKGKVALLSEAFAKWSVAMQRAYILSQNLSWLTGIVAHALTTPEMRKQLALALYEYYTGERPRLGISEPPVRALDGKVFQALSEIVHDQMDESVLDVARRRGAFSKRKSSRGVKYGGDVLDVSGYRSLMAVADCVKTYVESGRVETDELHLDVLDWALSGFEYKGIVFVLVHDQEFWSAVRTEFRCCQVLRAAARPTDLHLSAKCGRLCAVEGFGLRMVASPLVPHCVEPFNYPLPYTIAGDMLVKVYNAIPTSGSAAKCVMRVPNPQNRLSLFAPRFQVLSRHCSPYDAVTEDLMALGPPHLWCFFFGHPSAVARSLRFPSIGGGDGGGDRSSFTFGGLQVSQLLLPGTMPSSSPEVCRELAPLLKAYLDDLDRGISRRFLYDYWVLQRRAVPPCKGELGSLVSEARRRWKTRLSKNSGPVEEEGEKGAAGLTETILAKFLGGKAPGGGGAEGGEGRTTLITKRTLDTSGGFTNGECATEITKEYDPPPVDGEGISNHPQFAVIFDGTSWTRPAVVEIRNDDVEPALHVAASLFGCSYNDLLPYQPLDETIGDEADDGIWAFGHKCAIWTLAKGPKTGCGPVICAAGRRPKVGTVNDYFQVDTIDRIAPPLEEAAKRSVLRMCLPWSSSKFLVVLAPASVTIRPENYLLFPLMTLYRRSREGAGAGAGPGISESPSQFAPGAASTVQGHRPSAPVNSSVPRSSLGAGQLAPSSPAVTCGGRGDAGGKTGGVVPSPGVHNRILAVLRQRVPFLRHGGHLRKVIHHFGSNISCTLWLLWFEMDVRIHYRVAEAEAEAQAASQHTARKQASEETQASGQNKRESKLQLDLIGHLGRGKGRGASVCSTPRREAGTTWAWHSNEMEKAILLHTADRLVRELVACEIVATAVKRVVRMYTSELPDRPLPFVYAVEALLPVLFRPDLWWKQVEKMLPDERQNMRHHESCLMVALWMSVLQASQVVAMRPWELLATFNSILRTARSVPTTLAHCIMHALNVEFSSSFLYIISTVPEADEVDWFGRMQAIVQQQDAKERKRRSSAPDGHSGDARPADSIDDISSLEEAQNNAVVSLTTLVRCQEQFLIDMEEEEEDNRELKEKMVDASVKTVNVTARRYMSIDVKELYQVSSMLLRASFKKLELLPTEEMISTELLLLHALREHLVPTPLLMDIRRKTVAFAQRIARSPFAAALVLANAATGGAMSGVQSYRPRNQQFRGSIFTPDQEKFDSFVGKLLASNIVYAHDSAMAQYRLLVVRRFLEQSAENDGAGAVAGNGDGAGISPGRMSVLNLFAPSLTSPPSASVDSPARDGGASPVNARETRNIHRRRLPQVLDGVMEAREKGPEREKRAEEKDVEELERKVLKSIELDSDVELAKFLTPVHLGMLDGCRLLRVLSETGQSSRLTALFAGHSLLAWTMILISEAGAGMGTAFGREGRDLLMSRCIADFERVEEATRSLRSSQIEIAISILTLRGLVSLWNGYIETMKELFVEALLLLFDSWGDPRLYGGRGHPFLLYLSWALCHVCYLTRDWSLLRAYSSLFRAARLFYPSCPLSLSAPQIPGRRELLQSQEELFNTFSCSREVSDWLSDPNIKKEDSDNIVKAVVAYNHSLLAAELTAWIAVVHPANGLTFDQSIQTRVEKSKLGASALCSGASPARSGRGAQEALATDSRRVFGVDTEVINYDGGGQVPRSALSGRLLSLGLNASGQLGLGTPTAPVKADRLLDSRLDEANTEAAGSLSLDHLSSVPPEAVERDSTAFDEAARAGVDVWWTPQPSVICALKDTPVAFCSCGVQHSGAVDVMGRLWMWGSNAEGQVGASYRSFADVPKGFRLEELTSFSWNSVESALPDLGDLDCADYCLVSRSDFVSSRNAYRGSVLAPFLESYFVGEGRSAADAQESHSTAAGRGTDKNGPLLHAGDSGDLGLGVSSGKTKGLRHRFLAAAGNGSRSGSLSFEKTSSTKDLQAGGKGDESERTGEKVRHDSSANRCKTPGPRDTVSRVEGAKMRILTTASIPTLVLIPGQPSLRFKQVACGRDFTLALTTEGLIFAWGANSFGCLGLSHFTSCSRPQPLDMKVFSVAVTRFTATDDVVEHEAAKITDIRCGLDACAALSDCQALWVWGRAASGALALPPAYLEILCLGDTSPFVFAENPDSWCDFVSSPASDSMSGCATWVPSASPHRDASRSDGERRESRSHGSPYITWQSQIAKVGTADEKKKENAHRGYQKLKKRVSSTIQREGCLCTPTRLRILEFESEARFKEKMQEWGLWPEWEKKPISLISLRRTDPGEEEVIATIPDELISHLPTASEEVLFLDVAFGASHTVFLDISNNILTAGAGQMGQIAVESACILSQGKDLDVFATPEAGPESYKEHAAVQPYDLLPSHVALSNVKALFGNIKDKPSGSSTASCRSTACFHARRLLQGKRAVAVAAGGNVSAAVDENGELWVWGSNVDGLLSRPVEGCVCSATPLRVNLLDKKASDVAISPDGERLAVPTDCGEVLIWGRERFGSAGRAEVPSFWSAYGDDYERIYTEPGRVPLIEGYFVKKVALGRDFTLMMSGDPVGDQLIARGISRAPTVREKHQRKGLHDFLQSPITGQRVREKSLLLAGRNPDGDSQVSGDSTPRRSSKGSIYMEQLKGEVNIEYPKDMDAAELNPGPLTAEHAAPASKYLAAFNTKPPIHAFLAPTKKTEKTEDIR